MGLDLHKQLRQIQGIEAEIERALTLPAQVQRLISDIDNIIGQMQRTRFNLQTTLTDFKLNGVTGDPALYGDKSVK